LAEQTANSLGEIVITAKPSLSSLAGSQSGGGPTANTNNKIPTLGFSYAEVVGPYVAAGIIVSALFYAKVVIDLKRSEQTVRKNNMKVIHS
jgi:hypothetical protein